MFFRSKEQKSTADVPAKTVRPASIGQDEHKTTHPAIAEAVAVDMQSLFQGDLNETISVPMIHSTDNQRLRDAIIPFRSGRGNKTTQTVVIRKMTREHYLKRYAKDSEGNYVGTEKPAVDAGLVFVPSQSSSQEIMEQVRKVAFGKEHGQEHFQVGYNMEYAGGYNQ